ncbi:hypothetical protein [Halorubrum amylolyticum]|nr:hypothetical protein [Halorubrum amylolyticum]
MDWPRDSSDDGPSDRQRRCCGAARDPTRIAPVRGSAGARPVPSGRGSA